MSAVDEKKPFQRSAPTSLLIAFLAKVIDFRVITYAELSAVAHCDVQHAKRYHLARAIVCMEREHRKVFITERDVGIKLATDPEISAIGPSKIRHIRRTSRKARTTIAHADLTKLSNGQKLTHLAADALLGLQESSARGIVQKRMEAAFEKTGPKTLEADELLRLGGIKEIG